MIIFFFICISTALLILRKCPHYLSWHILSLRCNLSFQFHFFAPTYNDTHSSFKHCSFLAWHIHFSTRKTLSPFLEWRDSKGHLGSPLTCTPKQSVPHEALHGPALFHFALPSPSSVGIPYRLVLGLVFHREMVSLCVFLNFLKFSITFAYCLINFKMTFLRQVTEAPDMRHFPQMHLCFCKEIVVCLLNFFCPFFHFL